MARLVRPGWIKRRLQRCFLVCLIEDFVMPADCRLIWLIWESFFRDLTRKVFASLEIAQLKLMDSVADVRDVFSGVNEELDSLPNLETTSCERGVLRWSKVIVGWFKRMRTPERGVDLR